MADWRIEHQVIFYAWYGDLPLPCYFCDETITKWGRGSQEGHIHHVDGDHFNNNPLNLTAAHVGCHIRHHATGRKATTASNERRSATLLERADCPDCGTEYNSVWMTRHVRIGQCSNPTAEQLAEGAKASSRYADMARNQHANGQAGTYERTPEIRERISKSLEGGTQSEESNKKRSESLKKAYAEGRRADLSGKPRGKDNWIVADQENGSASSTP